MAKNSITDVIDNELDTIPRSSAITGTVTTGSRKDLVSGSGTAFTTELAEGDWLFDTTNSEVVQILNIVSDTELITKDEFTNAQSGATVKKVADARYTMISYLIETAAGTIDGTTFPVDTAGSIEMNRESRNARRFVDPIIFDTTPNGNKIYITAKSE